MPDDARSHNSLPQEALDALAKQPRRTDWRTGAALNSVPWNSSEVLTLQASCANWRADAVGNSEPSPKPHEIVGDCPPTVDGRIGGLQDTDLPAKPREILVDQLPGVDGRIDALRDTDLPPKLRQVLTEQPPNVDRRTGAALITRYLFPVSHRSLEAWPLPTRRVNGRALVPTETLFRVAFSKFATAPVIMGGRRDAASRAAAGQRNLRIGAGNKAETGKETIAAVKQEAVLAGAIADA